MSDVEMVIAVFFLFWDAVSFLTFLATYDCTEDIPITPKGIYEISDYNMPTCVIFSLFQFIFNPTLIVSKFFHWITRVGRKE